MKPVKLAVLTIADRQTGCHPLFLGSDILHGTSEWDKNMCRIHARFAKLGLATKLVFKDCRIDGLRKGDEAYFYSVRGLFRVVFEYHAFPVQQQCLHHLTDVWMNSSVESQPQLDIKYEVSLQNLVLAQDLPSAAADGENEGENEDKTSKLTSKTACAAIRQNCGQESSCDTAPDGLRISKVFRQEAPGKTPAQDVGTQTDPCFTIVSTSGKTVLVETVCKVCRMRQQRTEREKLEIEALRQLSKQSGLQFAEAGESAHLVMMPVRSPTEDCVILAETESGLEGVEMKDGCVHPKDNSVPVQSCSPSPVTRSSSTFPVHFAGEPCSEIVECSSACTEHEAEEPHIDTNVAPSADSGDSVLSLTQSDNGDEPYTLPLETFQQTAQCSKIDEREISMDVTEYVSGLHEKCLCHVQTQTDLFVFSEGTGSFSEADSLPEFHGTKTTFADNFIHPLTDPDTFCPQPDSENRVQESTDSVLFNELQVEKMPEYFSETGSIDVAGCVQKWMEEVQKLKLLLESQGTALHFQGAGHSFEDAAPDADAGTRTTHPQAFPQLEILLLGLGLFLRSMEAITTSSDISTVSEMLTLILTAVENSAELTTSSQDWQESSPLKSYMLTIFGAWLGGEFHHFKPSIYERVTAFKQKHITNISDLPSAAETLAELFPPCMVQLISAWIGLADMQNAESVERDHCYQSGGRASSAFQKRSQFPLMQLVLELLNNSLVSGIAHVVFCKL